MEKIFHYILPLSLSHLVQGEDGRGLPVVDMYIINLLDRETIEKIFHYILPLSLSHLVQREDGRG